MENTPAIFRFAAIQIISKSMAEMPNKNFQLVEFNFNVRFEIRVKADNKLVMPFVDVTITEKDDPIVLAAFKLAFIFEVVNFEESIKMGSDGLYIIPPDLDMTIKPIAISTARGIVFSELRGTYLQNAIMPVIYMNALVPETQPVVQPKLEMPEQQKVK